MLRQLPDPRQQSYITYSGAILLMTRILSSIFYISKVREAGVLVPLILGMWEDGG